MSDISGRLAAAFCAVMFGTVAVISAQDMPSLEGLLGLIFMGGLAIACAVAIFLPSKANN